jgi:hypothetical protein
LRLLLLAGNLKKVIPLSCPRQARHCARLFELLFDHCEVARFVRAGEIKALTYHTWKKHVF